MNISQLTTIPSLQEILRRKRPPILQSPMVDLSGGPFGMQQSNGGGYPQVAHDPNRTPALMPSAPDFSDIPGLHTPIPGMDPTALGLFRRADDLEAEVQSRPIPPPVRPAWRGNDAIAGGGALLLALLGGQGGGEAAAKFLEGYLGGKLDKAAQDTQHNRDEYERWRAASRTGGDRLRRDAMRIQEQKAREDKAKQLERSDYLSIAKAIVSDLDRMTAGNASTFLGRLRAVADKAGVPELAPSVEEESELIAGLIAAENRNLASRMVPQLMTTMRANGVPAARVTAGLLLLGIGRKHPDLFDTFGIDPAEVVGELAALTPREQESDARKVKIQGETLTNDLLRDPKVTKATADAQMAQTRAQYLEPKLIADINAKETAVEKAQQGMRLADERFDLSLVKDHRQAVKLYGDALKDRPKLIALKNTLEEEYRQLKARRSEIEAGSFALPDGVTAEQAIQQIEIAMQKNHAARVGIDAQGKAISNNLKTLFDRIQRGPSSFQRRPVGRSSIDVSGGGAALQDGFGPLTISPVVIPPKPVPPRIPQQRNLPPAPDRQPQVVMQGATAATVKPGPKQPPPGFKVANRISPKEVAEERKRAKAAWNKYKDPAARKAIEDEFKKATGERL